MGVIGNLMFAIGFKVTNGAVQKAEKDLDKLKGSTEGADKSISGLSAGFKTFSLVGAAAVATVVAGVAKLGHDSIEAATEYEKSMKKVQGATGSTAEQMEATRGIAQNLYEQNFGEDWSDLGQAITNVQQVTQSSGSELENATRNALLLRDAFGFEVNESVDAAQNAVEAFGITSTQAFNLIAQGSQKGLDSSGDLLDTLGEYSVYFQTLGFTADQMFDILATGAAGGARNVDLVADAVKEFGIVSKDNSASTIQGFKMLGLDADKMMKTIAGGGEGASKAFMQIVQMISDIEDPVERNQVGIALFGTKFEDLESTIVGSLGTATSMFDSTKDSMEELNKIKVETPGQSFELLKRQIETGILQPIGDRALPIMQRFTDFIIASKPEIKAFGQTIVDGIDVSMNIAGNTVDKFNSVLSTSTQFVKDHQFGLTVAAGILTTVFGPALLSSGIAAVTSGAQITGSFVAATAKAGWQATLTGAKIAAGLIPSLLRYASQGWITTASIVGTTTAWVAQRTIMGISTAYTWAMTAAQWALNAAFLANPLTWVVIGIVALVAAIIWMVTHWDTVTAVMGNVWNAIKDVWGKAMDFLSGIDLVQTGKDIVSGLINGIISMGSALWDTAKGIGKSIKDSITGFLDIHSPSRVMMEVGMYTGQGLADGITDSEEQVSGASAGLAGQVRDPFDESMSPASTPSAPSQPDTTAVRSGGADTQTIHLIVEVKGETPVSKQTATELAAELMPLIQNIFESTGRRLGVSTGGAN